MSDYQVPDFHILTPKKELEQRLANLQDALGRKGLDAALILFPIDLFYFTGTMQDSHLLVPQKGDPLLLVRRDLSRARAESGLDNIEPLNGLSKLKGLVEDNLGFSPKALGFQLDVLPVNFFRKYEGIWPDVEFIDIGPEIMRLRSVKSEFEIGCMKRAGLLARDVYGKIPDYLREGVSEIEIAGLMSADAYAKGHQNFLRMRNLGCENHTWHVIGGESGGIAGNLDASHSGYGLSPAFPRGASRRKLKAGEPLLVDFGICLDGYQVDLTRMFSIGRPDPEIMQAFEALQFVESEMLKKLKPGKSCGELFDLAVSSADEKGFGHAFLGAVGKKVSYAGHGLGLETNEPPVIARGRTNVLEEGMTVALELKMVLPGIGAVGLENTVVVREDAPEKITLADEEFIIV